MPNPPEQRVASLALEHLHLSADIELPMPLVALRDVGQHRDAWLCTPVRPTSTPLKFKTEWMLWSSCVHTREIWGCTLPKGAVSFWPFLVSGGDMRMKVGVLRFAAALAVLRLVRVAGVIVLFFLLLPCAAVAQDDGGSPWVRYTLKQRCYRHVDMFGATTYPCYRRVVPVSLYRPPRYYERERRHYDEPYRRYGSGELHPAPYYGPRCKDRIVAAVGFEYASEDRALKSAQLIYAATVRQEFGEMYQEITQARDVLTLCTQASVNDTSIGKLGDALFGENAVLKRCKIWARPCRPEIERASFAADRKEESRRNDPPARVEEYEKEPKPKRRWRWLQRKER
jgi:hypothetical protein